MPLYTDRSIFPCPRIWCWPQTDRQGNEYGLLCGIGNKARKNPDADMMKKSKNLLRQHPELLDELLWDCGWKQVNSMKMQVFISLMRVQKHFWAAAMQTNMHTICTQISSLQKNPDQKLLAFDRDFGTPEGNRTPSLTLRSLAYHFVNCSYHNFLCCCFANCDAWRQVNLHKFPWNMLPYNGFSNVVLARY